jgi:hypothetical protein
MTQTERFHIIQGTLLDQQNMLHEIELVIEAKQNPSQWNTKERSITIIEFARQPPVPDGGPYTLQYVVNGKQHKDRVHVKSGKLAMP